MRFVDVLAPLPVGPPAPPLTSNPLAGAAPAKINLTLRVTGRRADGFHDLESLVLQIGLCDRLEFRSRSDSRVTLTCDDASLPLGSQNLVYRAAEILADQVPSCPGADIGLFKSIPAGAGLGGGSSDAAATLRGLATLWNVDRRRVDLEGLGSALGSDVALFFHPPACIIRGRGERVQPCRIVWNGSIVLLLPPMHVSTAQVYARWTRDMATSDGGRLERTLGAGSARQLGDVLFNDLEPAVFGVCPELDSLLKKAAELGGRACRITGSGAAMFALFDDPDEAAAYASLAADRLRITTRVVAPWDGWQSKEKTPWTSPKCE